MFDFSSVAGISTLINQLTGNGCTAFYGGRSCSVERPESMEKHLPLRNSEKPAELEKRAVAKAKDKGEVATPTESLIAVTDQIPDTSPSKPVQESQTGGLSFTRDPSTLTCCAYTVDAKKSPINHGTYLKGFPVIHPYQSYDSDSSPAVVFCAADIPFRKEGLPDCLEKYERDIEEVKVVILSSASKYHSLYRPHYMLHSGIGSDSSRVEAFIEGSDCGEISFAQSKTTGVFSFMTHGTDWSVPSPNNATLYLNGDKELKEISSGSFWIVQKTGQEETGSAVATLFWLINDEQLKIDIQGLIRQEEQSWPGLLKELSDEKWGAPGQRLKALAKSTIETNRPFPNSSTSDIVGQPPSGISLLHKYY